MPRTGSTSAQARASRTSAMRAGLAHELPSLLRLASPVVLAELSWMAMSLVDTMMVGRVSAEAVGALSIGSHVFFTVAMAGGGILLGLDYVVAHAFGGGRMIDVGRALVQGIYLSLGLAIVATALLHWIAGELWRMGIEPAVLALTTPFVRTVKWGLPPLLVFIALRRYLQAIGRVRPILITAISANLVNVVAGWALIFGHLGAPALGALGAAWGMTIARAYMLLCLAGFVWFHARSEQPELLRVPLGPHWGLLRRIVALGVPAASQTTAEVGAFTAATLLAGRLDAVSLAAHQIALGAAALAFMVPLGVSSAAAVRVGQALGRREARAASRAGWTALLVGTAFMSLSAGVFLLLPELVMRVFTDEPAVIATGVSLLFVAAVFQLFDGLQVVGTGVLRGTGDTRTGMIAGLIGYWLVGLPLGAVLCFGAGLGVVGLWVGLSAGLVLVAIGVVVAWSRRAARLARP